MEYDVTKDPRVRTRVEDFEPGDWVRVPYGDRRSVEGECFNISTGNRWLHFVAPTGAKHRVDPSAGPVLLLERRNLPVDLELVRDLTQLCRGDLISCGGVDWFVVGEWVSDDRHEGLPASRLSNILEVHYLRHDTDTVWLVYRAQAEPLIVKGPAEQADRIRIDNPTVKVKAPAALLDALVVAYEQLTSCVNTMGRVHARLTGEGESVVEGETPVSVQQLARRVAELAGEANGWACQLNGAVGTGDVPHILSSEGAVVAAHDAVYDSSE